MCSAKKLKNASYCSSLYFSCKLLFQINHWENLLTHPICFSSSTPSASSSFFYLKLLQHQISKTGIIIMFAWVSLGSKKLIMKKLCRAVCIPNTCRKLETTNIHQSWHLANYPEVSLPPSLPHLPLSAVWHQSLRRKEVCDHSFHSPSSFSLLFIFTVLFHYKLVSPRLLFVFLTESGCKILSGK